MGCSHHIHRHQRRLQENPDTVFFSQTFKGQPSRRNLTDPVNRNGTDNGHKQLFSRFPAPFVKNRHLKWTSRKHDRVCCHFIPSSLCQWRHKQAAMCSKRIKIMIRDEPTEPFSSLIDKGRTSMLCSLSSWNWNPPKAYRWNKIKPAAGNLYNVYIVRPACSFTSLPL